MDEFLEALFADSLTPTRRLTIFTLPGERSRHFARLDLAVTYARQQSAKKDVYFGVGLIGGKPKGRGTADDVAGIGGLWADVDVAAPFRTGKALPATIEEAVALAEA